MWRFFAWNNCWQVSVFAAGVRINCGWSETRSLQTILLVGSPLARLIAVWSCFPEKLIIILLILMVNKTEIDNFWDNCVDDIVLTDGLEEDEDKFDKGFWGVADLWNYQEGGATELHWTHFSRRSQYQTRELMNRMVSSKAMYKRFMDFGNDGGVSLCDDNDVLIVAMKRKLWKVFAGKSVRQQLPSLRSLGRKEIARSWHRAKHFGSQSFLIKVRGHF